MLAGRIPDEEIVVEDDGGDDVEEEDGDEEAAAEVEQGTDRERVVREGAATDWFAQHSEEERLEGLEHGRELDAALHEQQEEDAGRHEHEHDEADCQPEDGRHAVAEGEHGAVASREKPQQSDELETRDEDDDSAKRANDALGRADVLQHRHWIPVRVLAFGEHARVCPVDHHERHQQQRRGDGGGFGDVQVREAGVLPDLALDVHLHERVEQEEDHEDDVQDVDVRVGETRVADDVARRLALAAAHRRKVDEVNTRRHQIGVAVVNGHLQGDGDRVVVEPTVCFQLIDYVQRCVVRRVQVSQVTAFRRRLTKD